jgi:hypothetical protein
MPAQRVPDYYLVKKVLPLWYEWKEAGGKGYPVPFHQDL